MARELRRLLIAPDRLAAAAAAAGAAPLSLLGEEAHYLARVLRLRPGERFAVVDGGGRLWSALLQRSDQALLEQPLQAPLQQQSAPRPALQLAVALPRRDADVLLRMVVELGIDRITPLRAERSVAAEPLKPARATAILREAVEQCERLWLPQLDPLRPAAELLACPPPAGAGRGWFCTTRVGGIPRLDEALALVTPGLATPGLATDPAGAAATVLIGPEGGWSGAEEALALERGWHAVSLGATILRSSTAAVAAAALLCSWRAGCLSP